MYRFTTNKIKHLFSLKLVRYGIVGGISTLIHIGVAALYIYAVNDSLMQSNIVGFLVAYVFSYVMQSLHVFGHAISWSKAFRYFLVQFGSLLTSVFISDMLGSYNAYVKTLFVVILMPLVTFVIHKFWTFKTP
ncbi:MAG: GtrA family protein [Sulfurovum sp.]|nr:MAG: GtrA family protein [Sulfurovum sp.]